MTMRVTLTPALAYASGLDAGNANMRKAGRKKWNRDDAQKASNLTNRLLLELVTDPAHRERIKRDLSL